MDRQDIEAFRRAEIDKTLAEMELDRRKDPRVCPSTAAPVVFSFNGVILRTYNISQGGMALYADDKFGLGSQLKGEITLPDWDEPVRAVLLIKARQADHLINAQFVEMASFGKEAIEAYIVRRQKEIAGFFFSDRYSNISN